MPADEPLKLGTFITHFKFWKRNFIGIDDGRWGDASWGGGGVIYLLILAITKQGETTKMQEYLQS